MELLDRISALQSSAERQLHALDNLKKTENALILPFFSALGYDPFDVREMEPDFEVGVEEQGRKAVSYVLKKDGAPVILVQCEEAGTDLGASDDSFLFQSFDELGADVAAFTNGLRYRFHANLDARIRGDGRPFLEFNLLEHDSRQVAELEPLTRPAFDAEAILSAAYNRTCGRLLREYVVQQQHTPDEPLVRFLATQVYEGDVSDDVLKRFYPVVQTVLRELVDGGREIQWQAPGRDDRSGSSADASEFAETEASESPKKEPERATQEKGASAEEEKATLGDDEDEQEGEDPFDKDLARRVIGDF